MIDFSVLMMLVALVALAWSVASFIFGRVMRRRQRDNDLRGLLGEDYDGDVRHHVFRISDHRALDDEPVTLIIEGEDVMGKPVSEEMTFNPEDGVITSRYRYSTLKTIIKTEGGGSDAN